MGEDNKTYTFTATFEDGIPDLECEPVVDELAEVAKSTNEATATLKALCEVMNVDKEALKEKMVINALKAGNKGYGCGYVGNFYADALSVIERLIKERNDYKARNDHAVKVNRELGDQYAKCEKERNDLVHKINRVECRLENPHFILGEFEEKRKYTKEDMIKAQIDVMDQANDQGRKIYKILTEDNEQ